MRIRVLCCSGSLDGGGSERQLWQLASNLDADEFAAQVYVLYRRGVYLDKLPSRIPVTDFSSSQAPPVYLPGGIHRAQVRHLATTLGRDQIEVVYDRTFHMTLVTAAACRRKRVPRVSVIVSPPSRDFQGSRERFAAAKKRLLKRAYGCPRSVAIAVSEAVAEDAAQFYDLPRDRFHVLPNPVDAQGIQAEARAGPAVPRLTSSSSNSLRFAVIGRFTAEKRQSLAIETLCELRRRHPDWDIDLELVGAGPQSETLAALASRLGVGDRTHFRGFMENPYPLMQSMDAILLPSLYEGLPNVALEAMVLGRPLIATRCSQAVRSLIGNDERGITARSDTPAQLAQALATVCNQTPAWKARTQAAQEYVEKHHGLASWMNTMQGMLRELVRPQRQV